MTTRNFLRKATKRDITISFKIAEKEYDELYMVVVNQIGEQLGLRLHGRQTAVFFHLLRGAFTLREKLQQEVAWPAKQAMFVEITRKQEEIIQNLQSEIHRQALEIERLQGDDERLIPTPKIKKTR